MFFPTNSHSECGAFLLTVLVTSAVISLIIVSSYLALQDLLAIYQEDSHSYLAKESSELELFARLGALSQRENPSALSCKEQISERGKVSLALELCFLDHQALQENLKRRMIVGQLTPNLFPRIDFNTILTDPSACSIIEASGVATSSRGFPLLPTSAKSSQICINPNLQGQKSFSTRNNFELDQPTVILSQNGNQPFLLTVAGYVDISSQLLVSNEIFVIAGGDIHIGELIAEKAVDVHLFSGTGRVQVDRLIGKAAVQVFSWEASTVPPSRDTEHGFSSIFLAPLEAVSISLTSAK